MGLIIPDVLVTLLDKYFICHIQFLRFGVEKVKKKSPEMSKTDWLVCEDTLVSKTRSSGIRTDPDSSDPELLDAFARRRRASVCLSWTARNPLK